MKFCLYMACVIFSFSLYGHEPKPCQLVAFDDIAEDAIPILGTTSSTGISAQDIETEKSLLKNCINNYAVCIVEAPPSNAYWVSKSLIKPTENKHFDPVASRLVFGMLQYVDKKTGNNICMTARNGVARTVPWYGVSWVINGKTVKQYEFWGDQFNTVMTPQSLYKALLKSHEEAVRDNHFIKSYILPNS